MIPWSGTPYITTRDLYRWSECLHSGAILSSASLFALAESLEGGKSALGMSGIEDEVPRKSLYLALRSAIYHDGFEAGRALFEEITTSPPDVYDLSDEEDDLYDAGRYLLRKGRHADAVRVFEWAASMFPQSTADR